MTSPRVLAAVMASVIVGCAAGFSAAASELRLIGSAGVRAALLELAPQFEQATGHKVVTDFAPIVVLKGRIAVGEAFDVVILGPELIDEFVA